MQVEGFVNFFFFKENYLIAFILKKKVLNNNQKSYQKLSKRDSTLENV